jgi:hypothetical protein
MTAESGRTCGHSAWHRSLHDPNAEVYSGGAWTSSPRVSCMYSEYTQERCPEERAEEWRSR